MFTDSGGVMQDFLNDYVAKQVNKINENWETTLRLHVKPRPIWMPRFVWSRLVALVFIQTEQRGSNEL